jgi:hypothetical protein
VIMTLAALAILFPVISLCSPILHKLNNVERNCRHQDCVHHSAFAQQELQDKPDSKKDCSSDPKHDDLFLISEDTTVVTNYNQRTLALRISTARSPEASLAIKSVPEFTDTVTIDRGPNAGG